eukprot:SAG11_NODE_4193_length_2021_cov_2.495317_2_plen_169_part_00
MDGREVKSSYLWVFAPVRGRYKYVPISAGIATGVAVVMGMETSSALYLLGSLSVLPQPAVQHMEVSCILPIFNLPYGKLLLAPKKLLLAALPLSTFPPARTRASSSLGRCAGFGAHIVLSAGGDRQREELLLRADTVCFEWQLHARRARDACLRPERQDGSPLPRYGC